MGSASGDPEISVCIPAYNEERNLGRLLEFLRHDPDLGSAAYEVLVEVSGSTDGTAAIARRAADSWPELEVLDSRARVGLLNALGRLLARARGRYVVRMDADVVPEPGVLGKLLQALARPGAGIASPRIVPSATRNRWVNRFSETEWEIHHWVSVRAPKTTVVQAFCRFPMRLPQDSGIEDGALQLKVEESGRVAVYVADARVRVMPPSSVRGVLVQRSRNIAQIRRHRDGRYRPPSTALLRFVYPATLEAIRDRRVRIPGLVVFAAVEGAARIVALGHSISRGGEVFDWEPIDGTKELSWPTPARGPLGNGSAPAIAPPSSPGGSGGRPTPVRFSLPASHGPAPLKDDVPARARGDLTTVD